MSRQQAKHPTELELEILKILWGEGARSGREIRELLADRSRELTYSSVMTMLGIMEQKEYVKRKKRGGSFVYSARIKENATTRRMLKDLVQRAYDGSVISAMVNLLEANEIDAGELEQLKALLNEKTEEKSE